MLDILPIDFPPARAALVIAVDVALKSGAFLAAAYAAHALLGPRRALARSALWNACLVGLVLLPVTTLLVPRLNIPLPWPAVEVARPATMPATAPPAPRPIAVATPFMRPEPRLLVSPIGPRIASRTPDFASDAPARRIGMFTIIGGVYFVVIALLAARLFGSLAAVARLCRSSTPVANSAWLAVLERWRGRLGVSRRVALRASDRVTVPLVVGWLRPAILLPRSLSADESPTLIDAVLLHELAHIRRGDFGWNLVRRLVQIVYWPNPLTWPLGRIIGSVREQSCDDLCVHALGDANAYRATLLDVAAALVRRPDAALGLAMARPTNLAHRLAWIDRTAGSSRCLMPTPARLTFAALILSLAGLLGTLQFARASRAADDPAPARPVVTRPSAETKSVDIRVLADDTGKPLPGAIVKVEMDFTEADKLADADGRVRVDLSKRRYKESLSLEIWAEGYVQKQHYFSRDNPKFPDVTATLTVRLHPADETLGGLVTDEEGKPIAGAKVEISGQLGGEAIEGERAYKVPAITDAVGRWRSRSFRAMKSASLYLSHPDFVGNDQLDPRFHAEMDPSGRPRPGVKSIASLRDFSDVEVMTRGVSLDGIVTDSKGRPVAGAHVGKTDAQNARSTLDMFLDKTVTDAAGHFRFSHTRPVPTTLIVKAPGHAPGLKTVEVGEKSGPVSIQLDPPRPFSGRVVDSRGTPMPNANVYIGSWRNLRLIGEVFVTDSEGRFRWDSAPADTFQISASLGSELIVTRDIFPGEEKVTLPLNRRLSVTGKILDDETGKPVAQADLEVGLPDPASGEIWWKPRPNAFDPDAGYSVWLDAEDYPEYRLRIKAPGYQDFETRPFRSDAGSKEEDIRLVKSRGPTDRGKIAGFVNRPDGSPLEGADVVLALPSETAGSHPVSIVNGTIKPGRGQEVVKTDQRGRFALNRPGPDEGSFSVVIVHSDGYAEPSRSELEADPRIRLKPWGRIEGSTLPGIKTGPGSEISYQSDRLGNPDVPAIYASGKAVIDKQGRFLIERIVPGDVRVGIGPDRKSVPRGSRDNGTLVDVHAGETSRVEVGRRGRPVIAKVQFPVGNNPTDDYSSRTIVEIQSGRPHIPAPPAGAIEPSTTWTKQWWASAEGREYRRNWIEIEPTTVQPDGSIRIDDVPAGTYFLKVKCSPDEIWNAYPERIATATRQFLVPPIQGGQSDVPLDLGVLRPAIKATLNIGEPAPDFRVETLDGKVLTLADFRGRFLLLDFWATWCGPCIGELPSFKEVYANYGKDQRFAMLSLSLDADKDAPRKFAAENGMAWDQGYLGQGEGGMQEAYHVQQIPSTFLIGPDGMIRANGLRGDTIGRAVEEALKVD
ncbi:carboxypeptidase regulatory-like domain-containing protein [Isosphaeraceae bacterium EP7]